jgi:ABC-type Zn2+ transport system substrate-binding protein/surface adhesin
VSGEESGKRRMKLPKKEEDIEIEHEESSEVEEHHHEHQHEEISPEDYSLLLMNTIAHTLGHVESDLSSLNQNIKQLMSQVDDLRKSVELVARVLLIDKIKDQELRKKFINDIIEELTKS